MSILNYFPAGETPRDCQVEALQWVEDNWGRYDVFVLNMPVGSGKAYVAQTIARWQEAQTRPTAIITPNKMLQDQYAVDCPDIPNLKGMSNYICESGDGTQSCEEMSEARMFKGRRAFCPGCPYKATRDACKESPISIYNIWTYFSNRMFKKNLIIDEAHNVLDFLTQLSTLYMWRHKEPYPPTVSTLGDLAVWMEGYVKKMERDLKTLHSLTQIARVQKRINKFRLLLGDIKSQQHEFHFRLSKEMYQGQLRPRATIIPMRVRNLRPRLWPTEVEKIILMSATIDMYSVSEMGLHTRRIGFIETGSPIPADQRPFIVKPRANMSYRTQEQGLPNLVDGIEEILDDHPDCKGIVHLPYGVAAKLELLSDNPRLMFHNKDNKVEQYQKFREVDNNSVLIASGMAEGLDLAGREYGFQIIGGMPFISIADPFVKDKMKREIEWYDRNAARTIQQQSGRICRGPNDTGATYILDSRFEKWFYRNQNYNKFANWFRETLVWD